MSTPQPAKIPYAKPPTSFAHQVQLWQQRGLSVPDPEIAEFYLSQLNYYRLAAYFLPFEQNHTTHQIVPRTSFEDVLNLYVFDRELRLLVMDAIERIEVSLRTQMAYHLSHNHNTAHPHLDPTNFHNQGMYNGSKSKLTHEVQRSTEDFIQHITSKYQEALPPIWAVVELMTMGQLSRWFSNIKNRSDRNDISQIYQLDERIMTSYCEHLSLVRNHSAHHARLWNRELSKLMKLPRQGPNELLNSLNYLSDGDRRLRKIYNTLTMAVYLMNIIAPDTTWRDRLIFLIHQHSIDATKMGFPIDWNSRPLWKQRLTTRVWRIVQQRIKKVFAKI